MKDKAITAEVMDLEELKELMGEEDINTIDKFDNVGVLTTSNYGGMVILINKTGESVFVQEVWGYDKYKPIEEKEIMYNEEGNQYFDYEDSEYQLNEFLRKNY